MNIKRGLEVWEIVEGDNCKNNNRQRIRLANLILHSALFVSRHLSKFKLKCRQYFKLTKTVVYLKLA